MLPSMKRRAVSTRDSILFSALQIRSMRTLFPRARFRDREGVELETPDEGMAEDAELLPGAVGPVMPCGHDIQGELALEFGDRLLLRSPAAAERVEGGQVERHVRGDGGVLKVAVVGSEEIQLEVLGAPVA